MWPNLSKDQLSRPKRLKRVAIVTMDFAGPERNGGIGTAYASLAEALAKAGHRVTVVFTNPKSKRAEAEFKFWTAHYRKQKIRLEALPTSDTVLQWDAGDYFGLGPKLSYDVYQFLKKRDFDVVHFPECGGIGYYSLAAKKAGIAFSRTLFCTIIHSPTIWQKEYNQMLVSTVEGLQVAFLERKTAELADVVVAPSQYALEWVQMRGWKLPKRTYVEQYIFPESELVPAKERPSQTAQNFDEIVLFGRIEPRKGIDLFCRALQLLPPSFLNKKKITFLGGFNLTMSPWAQAQFIRTLEQAKFRWRVIRGYDRIQALDYLRSRNALVVIPSKAETLGYTVMECLQHRIPFLASDIPAFQELIAKKGREEILFAPRAEDLARKIHSVHENGIHGAFSFAVPPKETQSRWVTWHNQVTTSTKNLRRKVRWPKLTVCLLHQDRPQFLKQALRSLRNQTVSNFDVLIVDNGSRSTKSKQTLATVESEFPRNWKLLRLSSPHSPAEARNRAIQKIRGDYVLFMDDDNLAKAHEIETFLRAAKHSKADILTCFSDRFQMSKRRAKSKANAQRWLVTGDDLTTGVFYNVFGDMNALIRKKTITQLGGFRQLENAGHEDWEFFARAVQAGHRLQVVPEALYWHRNHKDALTQKVNPWESARLHLSPLLGQALGPETKTLLEACFSIQRFHRTGTKAETGDGADFPRLFFDPKHTFTKPVLQQKNPVGKGLVRTKQNTWFRLPPMKKATRDILFETILTSSSAGAFRISYKVFREGHLQKREVIRSIREGRNQVFALLDLEGLRGGLHFSPLDRSGECRIENLNLYEETNI